MTPPPTEQPIDVDKESKILIEVINLLGQLSRDRRKRVIQAAETFLETKSTTCRGRQAHPGDM
jgi:hypothetical protein